MLRPYKNIYLFRACDLRCRVTTTVNRNARSTITSPGQAVLRL